MNYLNYFLLICASILSILLLKKDWEALKKPYIRFSVLVIIILIGVGGIININISGKRNETQRQKDNVQITKLQQALETSENNRKSNTTQFLNEFNRLSQEISDLETQVKTTELKKKIANLQSDLDNTRKALITPKATLTLTFPKSDNDGPIIRTVTLPVKDNVVHVEFTVQNISDVAAIDGDLTVGIGSSCKFASDPPHFQKLLNNKDTERVMRFDRILPRTLMDTLSADIIVPQSIKIMGFGISYRCRTCIIPEPNENIGTIKLSR